MKGCNYKKRGDVVPPQWKVALLRWLGHEMNFRSLVETGTCFGATCMELHNDFDKIYTVELSDELYDVAKENFDSLCIKNVVQYRGSSRRMLSVMLADVPPGPVLFYLDAHRSGKGTSDDGDALPDELRAVMQLRPDSLVVIDDCADCELEPVQKQGVDLTDWHREYRTGMVIMWREGQYDVPPFEDGVWSEQ